MHSDTHTELHGWAIAGAELNFPHKFRWKLHAELLRKFCLNYNHLEQF